MRRNIRDIPVDDLSTQFPPLLDYYEATGQKRPERPPPAEMPVILPPYDPSIQSIQATRQMQGPPPSYDQVKEERLRYEKLIEEAEQKDHDYFVNYFRERYPEFGLTDPEIENFYKDVKKSEILMDTLYMQSPSQILRGFPQYVRPMTSSREAFLGRRYTKEAIDNFSEQQAAQDSNY